ncbi:MAG: hypothetical protein KDB05_29055 [Planctomycetales bacterium]|nr:hypothetical protein [Planctomycetales bacterium]
MISYSPPKSQAWGHRVGRHTATKIVDLGMKFLSEQCSSVTTPQSELEIGWMCENQPELSRSIDELTSRVGEASATIDFPFPNGLFRQNRWSLSSTHLTVIAEWFDRVKEQVEENAVVATCGTCWGIQWKNDPETVSGGMFGIHLGRPHRITTMFTFPDISRYEMTKRYLIAVGFVTLSDKHISPKTALSPRNQEITKR